MLGNMDTYMDSLVWCPLDGVGVAAGRGGAALTVVYRNRTYDEHSDTFPAAKRAGAGHRGLRLARSKREMLGHPWASQ